MYIYKYYIKKFGLNYKNNNSAVDNFELICTRLLCTAKPTPNCRLSLHLPYRIVVSFMFMFPSSFHLISCNATILTLYFSISLTTLIAIPGRNIVRTFHIPKSKSCYLCPLVFLLNLYVRGLFLFGS